MALAARIGISVRDWEHMSPYELQVYAAAYAQKLQESAKADRAQAYLHAALNRVAVYKKQMPSYESIFPDDVRKVMSDEAMYQTAVALNKALGGTEETDGRC